MAKQYSPTMETRVRTVLPIVCFAVPLGLWWHAYAHAAACGMPLGGRCGTGNHSLPESEGTGGARHRGAEPQVALFTSPTCLGHATGSGHPESPARLATLIDLALNNWTTEFSGRLRVLTPSVDVSDEQLLRVHTPRHVTDMNRAFRDTQARGSTVRLDGDTVVSPGTAGAARRAAGLVVAAVDATLRPSAASQRAFVMVRPPGHHAEPAAARGFCLFNNVMVGVAHAEAAHGLRRVAVLDFDVHHGNGGAAMARGHAGRLYASAHQSPLFPGSGTVWGPSGDHGEVISAPLPAGTGSRGFRAAWRDLILPAVRDFAPEMVFVSAGFDGHAADPLASWALGEDDFEWVTGAIVAASRGAPVVSVLEGGYDIPALGRSVGAHIAALVRSGPR